MGNLKHNYGIGSERMSPATKPHGRDERDIEFQIHHLEAEAYHAVLKAFSAQSDNLTWEREALMTDLRKELNITDDEHGELLIKIKSDESTKVIREWRNDTRCSQECRKDAPRYPQQRKLETSHPPVSKSQNCASCSQPCKEIIPSAARDAQIGGMRVKHGRNLNQGNSRVLKLKYQRQLRNDQRSADLAMLFSENSGQPMNMHNPQVPTSGRSTGLVKSQLNMGFNAPGSNNLKKSCDLIRIRPTDQIIHQVERLITQERLVQLHVEKAKLILREHERAILEALSKLSDVSDVADSTKQMGNKYPREDLRGVGREMFIRNEYAMNSMDMLVG